MSALLALVPWWGRAIAILAVLAAAVAFGAVKMHEHDQAKYDALNLAYASFKADVKAKGDIALKAAAAQEQRQQEVTNGLKAKLASADADLARARERLRSQPPSRPDGSAVPVTACHPEGAPAAASAESVPLAEYRALEARAAYDVQTIDLLQGYLEKLVAAGALRAE